MFVQGSSVPAPRPSMTPVQEHAPSPSNSLGDATTIAPPPGKKATGKKASRRKPPKQTRAPDSVDPKRAKGRYEPYRKADPTPEPEASLPADPGYLDSLDATAKMLYKRDREVLEYVKSLKKRTAAMLDHVDRNDSQLRSHKGTMKRIRLFASQWSKMEDRWSHEELLGDGNFRATWRDGKMVVLEPDEPDDEVDNAPYAEQTYSLFLHA